MKKYKLIKEYPGSPKLNTILKEDGNFYTSPINQQIFRHNGEIENYPEFWEEIVEKDYEILSFIHNGEHGVPKNTIVTMRHGRLNNNYQELTESHYLNSKCWTIHSVKRLSDSEIFTVGDRVTGGKIIKFFIKSNNLEVSTDHSSCYYPTFIGLRHCKKKPLFTTEDGVDIYEGDNYHWVKLDTFIFGENIAFQSTTSIPSYKYFSTKEAVEEYILMNKPCLSINDVIKEFHISVNFKQESIRLEKLKRLVNLKLN